jgi:hypothetical protein
VIEMNDEIRQLVKEHPDTPIELVNPETRQAFVLIPAEVYERLTHGDYDDSPWTEEEMDLLAAEDADRLGWEGMEAYQDPQP